MKPPRDSSTELLYVPINARTKLMGLIGGQLDHTLSPKIHNFAASVLGVNALYLPFELLPTQLEAFLKCFWDLGALGFNVTFPYKQLIATMLDAQELPAVNTIYRGPDGWRGASTDAQGFALALRHIGYDFTAFSKIIFLGNGGAVVSLLQYLFNNIEDFPEIVVLRRDPSRDATLNAVVPGRKPLRMGALDADSLMMEIAGRAGETLLIQATSAPLRGDDLGQFIGAMRSFYGVVVDLTYGTPSALYHAALAKGLPCQDGRPMLIEQARLSQQLWWGDSISYQKLEAVLGR